jgi:hypothetical protein
VFGDIKGETGMTYARFVAFSVLAMIGMATAALAQVVARQGPAVTHKFHSPMILEVPLPNITRYPIGGLKTLGSDIPNYTCDDVSLPSLTVEVKKRSQRKGNILVLEIAGGVLVPSSHDRLVDLIFIAKRGDAVIGRASVLNLDAEEGRTTSFRTDITLDEVQLREAFAAEPHPIIEMTVTVRDNG